jgi:hypothetical protein
MTHASVAPGRRAATAEEALGGGLNDSHMPWSHSLTAALRPGRTVAGVQAKEAAVLDLLMIAMTVVFFALAFLFVKGLERV